jgi:hypothetical protein
VNPTSSEAELQALPIMSDDDAKRFEEALARACAGDPTACLWHGHALLAVDPSRARDALEKGCVTAPDPARCGRDAAELVAVVEALRAACAESKPYACGRLADFVHEHDYPRTTRALRDECTARRIADVSSCIGHRAVEQLVGPRTVPTGVIGVIAPGVRQSLPADELARRRQRAVLRAGVARGMSEADAQKLFAAAEPGLRACYADRLAHNPHLMGRVGITFTMDGIGYPFLVHDEGSDLPDLLVVRCALRAFEEVKTDLSGMAATLPVIFSPE